MNPSSIPITLTVPRDEANARLPQGAPRFETDVQACVNLKLEGSSALPADAPQPLVSAIEEAERILAPDQERLFAWLAADPANARAFVLDPMATLRSPELAVDASVLDRLAALTASVSLLNRKS